MQWTIQWTTQWTIQWTIQQTAGRCEIDRQIDISQKMEYRQIEDGKYIDIDISQKVEYRQIEDGYIGRR